MRFTLDSNILVYVHDHRDELRRKAALTLLGKVAAADCVLTLQSLAEFFRVATVKLGLPVGDAAKALRYWRDLFPVAAAQADTLDDAVSAVGRHGIAFWDAMLWATAREAGCAAILSEDFQDGRTLGGVRFVDPFKPSNAAYLDRLFDR